MNGSDIPSVASLATSSRGTEVMSCAQARGRDSEAKEC